MANEVAQKNTFSTALSAALSTEDITPALPENFNKARFVQNAVALLNGNEQLMDFAKKHGTQQIINGLKRGALLNLDFYSGEAYLVCYGSTLQFMPSFKGDRKLAMQFSVRPVRDIYAKVVRQGDEFEEVIVNGEPSINFKPIPFNKGEIIGVFAVCMFKDGGLQYEVLSKDDIEACRNQSKAKGSPAWSRFYGEMAKKCAIHRLCKSLELNMDARQQDSFNAGMEIETDPQKQAKNDIEDGANAEEFVTADVVDDNEDTESENVEADGSGDGK